MQNLGAAWLYPLILVAGALQAWGAPMNGALRGTLNTPWLASIVSFLPVVFLLAILFFCLPRPLPTAESVTGMPWWAPLGRVVSAFAVVTGLLFVDKIGAGTFAGFMIKTNIQTLWQLTNSVSGSTAFIGGGRWAAC